MELQEHRAPPALGQRLRRVGDARRPACQESDDLRVDEVALALAVRELDAALGRVAALENEVQFVLVDRQFDALRVDVSLNGAEEVIRGGELHLRPDRPRVHVLRRAQVPPGGAAAVIADAIHPKQALEAGVPLHREQKVRHPRGDLAVVAVRRVIIRQHPRAVLALPPEKLRHLPARHARQPGAVRPVVVVPADAPALEDARQGPAVTERIGFPVDLARLIRQAEGVFEPSAGVKQVPRQDLTGGHVLVALDPLARRDIPAALGDALFDALEQVRRVLAGEVVDRGLALREVELRELVHELVHRGERVVGDGHRLRPGPHPVHVNMRVARAVDDVLPCRLCQGREVRLGLRDEGFRVSAAAQALHHEAYRLSDEGLPLVLLVLRIGHAPGEVDFGREALDGAVFAACCGGEALHQSANIGRCAQGCHPFGSSDGYG